MPGGGAEGAGTPVPPGAVALVASVVDVGSNSVLLLTVWVAPDGRACQVDAALETTRLGSRLGDGGRLDPDARARTRGAVVAMSARARTRGASRLWGFATGAVRRARDGGEFATELGAAAGCPIEVLSGADEAALAYAAVEHAFGSDDRPLLAVDVGGATTELALGRGESVVAAASLPLGALALTEGAGDAAALVERTLGAAELPARARAAGASLVASGGTATALAALDLGLAAYGAPRVHGHVLAVERLGEIAQRAGAGVPGVLDSGRARILPAGALVLERVARAAGAAALRVSDHGVRHGYLRRRLEMEGVLADLRALWG